MAKLNVASRTIFISDNLPVLENINSKSVDLIYLDPPFNSNRNHIAPIGSPAEGSGFKDIWNLDDLDEAWLGQISEYNDALASMIVAVGKVGGKGDSAYLAFMARRLIEMKRILKDKGSIYLHCDQTMSHSLKLIMDAIFGESHYRNEIIWSYRKMPNKAKHFQKNHDAIFFYAKGKTHVWNRQYEAYAPSSLKTYESAKSRGYNINYKKKMCTVFDWDKFHDAVEKGLIRDPDSLKLTEHQGLGSPMRAVWDIPILAPTSKMRTGYPTQKPDLLLERIIKTSSNEGDVVLDPFCGCATTCVAAERLGRKWIGIDVSANAKILLKQRLENSQHLFSVGGVWQKVHINESVPIRSDQKDKLVNPKEYKHVLYGKQEGVCAGCKHHFPFRNMTVDHINPRVSGGGDTHDNLQLLCGACNSTKGNKDMTYLLARLKKLNVK